MRAMAGPHTLLPPSSSGEKDPQQNAVSEDRHKIEKDKYQRVQALKQRLEMIHQQRVEREKNVTERRDISNTKVRDGRNDMNSPQVDGYKLAVHLVGVC